MPLWRIFAHPDTFSLEQRKGLSTAITKLYRDLPEFYVAVLFIEVKEDQVWVGGKSKSNFVRIVVEQIARQLPAAGTTEGQRVRPVWMNKINEVSEACLIVAKTANCWFRHSSHSFKIERSLNGNYTSMRRRWTCGGYKGYSLRLLNQRWSVRGRRRTDHSHMRTSEKDW
jgi:hypothetical protein